MSDNKKSNSNNYKKRNRNSKSLLKDDRFKFTIGLIITCFALLLFLSLISYLFKKFSVKLENSRDYIKLVLNFNELISAFKPYISEDLLLGSFNQHFLSLFQNKKHKNFLFNILNSEFLKYNNDYGDGRSHLSLDFCYKNKNGLIDKNLPNLQTDKIFIKNLNIYCIILGF